MTPRNAESQESSSIAPAPVDVPAPSDAPAAASAAAPAAEQPPHPTAAVVETWFQKHFHNMSSLFDARAYTVLLGAKEDLKAVLAAL